MSIKRKKPKNKIDDYVFLNSKITRHFGEIYRIEVDEEDGIIQVIGTLDNRLFNIKNFEDNITKICFKKKLYPMTVDTCCKINTLIEYYKTLDSLKRL